MHYRFPRLRALALVSALAGFQADARPFAPVIWVFERDQEGAVISLTRPGQVPTQVSREFHPDGIPKSISLVERGGDVVAWEMDGQGRLATLRDPEGETTYLRRADGSIAEAARSGIGMARFGWVPDSDTPSLDLGGGLRVAVFKDLTGRISGIDTPAGKISFSYNDREGTIQRLLPNGVETLWHTHPDGTVSRITHAGKDRRVLANYEYQYRADGKISRWNDDQIPRAFAYDDMGRLTKAASSENGESETFSYDAAGQRVEPDSELDWLGRFVRLRGTECRYDEAGNLLAYGGGDGAREIAYNRYFQAELMVSPAGRVLQRYDGEGGLLHRSSGGAETKYFPDPRVTAPRTLWQTDDRGRQVLHLWLGEITLASLMEGGNEALYYLEDLHGSARLVVNSLGQVVEKRRYTAFGRPLKPFTTASPSPGFCGMWWDGETQLYQAGARLYDPELGRFLQLDPVCRIPMGTSEDIAPYSYCGFDPVNFTDRGGCARAPASIPWMDRLNLGWNKWSNMVDARSATLWYHEQAQRAQAAGRGVSAGAFDLAAGYVNAWVPVPNSDYWSDQQRHSMYFWQIALQGGPGLAMNGFNAAQHLAMGRWSELTSSTLSLGLGGAALATQLRAEYWGRLSNWATQNAVLATLRSPGSPWAFDRGQFAIKTQLAHEFARHAAAGASAADSLFTLGTIAFDMARHHSGTVPHPMSARAPKGGDSSVGVTFSPDLWGRVVQANGEVWLPGIHRRLVSPIPDYPITKVGGIDLAGAGKALACLGALKGIALDAQGRWLLLGTKEGEGGLPPLRLDDVALIFQMVYQLGLAPQLSIDPKPTNPKGPKMDVRYFEHIPNTYVGWTLLETDRLMKCYNLGQDNLPPNPVLITTVPDYPDPFREGGPTDGDWERFWIVPDQIHRRPLEGTKQGMLDLRMKVNTQRMTLNREGKLVPSGRPSSTSAVEFTEWFTGHYDEIASEATSTPPKGFGVEGPVHVFKELKRLALVVAIAEKMRDDGIPLPAWLENHSPTRLPLPAETYALRREKTEESRKGNLVTSITRSLHGGVNLTAQDVPHSDGEPHATASTLREALASEDFASPVEAESPEGTLVAVALPGESSLIVHPNMFTANDLQLPLPGGGHLSLTKTYSSMNPTDEGLGVGWSFDLPTLRERRLPQPAKDGVIPIRILQDIRSPLGTWSATNVSLWEGQDERFSFKTTVWRAGEGTRWTFDPGGRAVMVERSPYSLVFIRDSEGRPSRLEGRFGKKVFAAINLKRDKEGMVIAAFPEQKEASGIRYTYGKGRELLETAGDRERTRYTYENGRLASIQEGETTPIHWGYDTFGRVTRVNGTQFDRQIRQGITSQRAQWPGGEEVWELDEGMRPLHHSLPDGSVMEVTYAGPGRTEARFRQSGVPEVVARSEGGTVWIESSTGERRLRLDTEKGSLDAWSEGEAPVPLLHWDPQGENDDINTARWKIRGETLADSVPSRQLVMAPVDSDTATSWLETKYDANGNPSSLANQNGLSARLISGPNGDIRGLIGENRGGYEIEKDPDGRPSRITTSYGYEEMIDYKQGRAWEVQARRGEASALMRMDEQGRIVRLEPLLGTPMDFTYGAGPTPTGIHVQNGPDVTIWHDDDDDDRRISAIVHNAWQLTVQRSEARLLVSISPPEWKEPLLAAMQRLLPPPPPTF